MAPSSDPSAPCRSTAIEGCSFHRGGFDSTWQFFCRCLCEGGVTGHAAEHSEVRPECHDVVVPVHEQKPVQKSQLDAIALHVVGAETSEGDDLSSLAASAHCCLHAIVDLDLQVEEVAVFGLRLGQLVEEVVQQEEVAEEVPHRERGGGRGRGRGRGLRFGHYQHKLF